LRFQKNRSFSLRPYRRCKYLALIAFKKRLSAG